MNQVQVEVRRLQVSKRLIQRGLHVLGAMDVIPQLRGDEDVFAGHPGFLNRVADLNLVGVYCRGVDVAVSGLEGHFDGDFDFLGFGLLQGAPGQNLSAAFSGGRIIRVWFLTHVPRPIAGISWPELSLNFLWANSIFLFVVMAS